MSSQKLLSLVKNTFDVMAGVESREGDLLLLAHRVREIGVDPWPFRFFDELHEASQALSDVFSIVGVMSCQYSSVCSSMISSNSARTIGMLAYGRVTADAETLRVLRGFSEREINKATGLSRRIIRRIRNEGQVKYSTMQRITDFLVRKLKADGAGRAPERTKAQN